MPTVKAINWIENYRGFIGPISDKEADAWANVIRMNVRNVMAGEVDQAVASLCAEDRHGNTRPNAMSIIRRIYDHRRSHRPADEQVHPIAEAIEMMDGHAHVVRIGMDQLKRDLDHTTDPDIAWTLICTPADAKQCRALQAYADRKGIRYERIKPTLAESVGRIVEKFEEAMT